MGLLPLAGGQRVRHAAVVSMCDNACCLCLSTVWLSCVRVLRFARSYEVVKKSRKAADELAERLLQFVDARGNVQCGIIYCLSR